MSEFKKWWSDWSGSNTLPENTDIRYAFEAGQQSQQAKINELQRQVVSQGQRFNDQAQKLKDVEYLNQKLQGRIDRAMKLLSSEKPLELSYNNAMYALMALKGNKDE